MNSLIHGFEQKEQGTIRFDITNNENILHIRYSDDGKGISLEEQKKIFEPFYTTKRNQGGSGLGLNIIHNLVTHRLQGNIRCESEPGKGTMFIIELPEQKLENPKILRHRYCYP